VKLASMKQEVSSKSVEIDSFYLDRFV